MRRVSGPHHIFLLPGMFGFGRLAGYDYFQHLRRALVARFIDADIPALVEVVAVPPTASIRRRAIEVAQAVWTSSRDDDGPIHLVGHSTGGLDARLLLSPTAHFRGLPEAQRAWTSRVRSLTTLNTPHHGTPLAAFFATVSGTRLLYALSLLTVTTLSVGRPGLAALARMMAALGTLDEIIGVDVKLLDEATSLALRFVGDRGRLEVSSWLSGIREDQGGIIQLMPESMDLFNAAAEDDSRVRYGCIASASPPPAPIRFAARVRSPYAALSATLYTTLYQLTAREPPRYPYPEPTSEIDRIVEAAIGRPSDPRMNDGIVPLRSMLWGEPLWIGKGDHLDVVGHFADLEDPAIHVDWLSSGARFNRASFAKMTDAIGDFILRERP